jgi:hypothetical protein
MTKTHAGIAFLVLSGVFAYAFVLSERRLRLYIKGAQGEENVARMLSFLPSNYRVFHGIAFDRRGLLGSGQDLDHVVVGPTGIFVVETKNWSGMISVRDGAVLRDGETPDRDPLEQVRTAAQSLQDAFHDRCHAAIHVQPILCFASGTLRGGGTGALGVIVCTTESLNRILVDSTEPPLGRDVQLEAARILEAFVARH